MGNDARVVGPDAPIANPRRSNRACDRGPESANFWFARDTQLRGITIAHLQSSMPSKDQVQSSEQTHTWIELISSDDWYES